MRRGLRRLGEGLLFLGGDESVLGGDMRRATGRIAADLEKEITFTGKEHLEQLRPNQRIDLFLFYKESLTNIIRHSEATRVASHLRVTPAELTLKVMDNGQGIQQSFVNGVPPSLSRRARLLGATVKAKPGDSGGTELTLKLRLGRPWPLNLFDSKTNLKKA